MKKKEMKKKEACAWFALYTLFKTKKRGANVSFQEMYDLTGIDLYTNRSTLYRADRELREKDFLTIFPTGYGYKIASYNEVRLKEQRKHLIAEGCYAIISQYRNIQQKMQ